MDKVPEKRTSHHYVLAHFALRQVAFDNPYAFFAIMASPKRQDFLDSVWKNLCRNFDEKQGTAHFTVRDLEITTTRLGDYPTVLIQMPKPYFPPEAYMVCVVLKVPVQQLSTQPKNPAVLYYTLERGMNMDGSERTVFCGWNRESHFNCGPGPEANAAAFLAQVQQVVSS